MPDKKKIVVAYVEAGMGHIVTAQAISDALKKYYSDKAEVKDVYFFQQQGDVKMVAFEQGLIEQVKLSNKVKGWGNVWFKAMQIGDNPQKLLHDIHETFFKNVKETSFELFSQLQCDIFVCTHYIPIHFACEYKALHPESKMKIVTYVPDNNVHGWWDNRVDLTITNNEKATQFAITTLGFPPTNIKTVPLLAREAIKNATADKQLCRQKFGIDPDAFAVVLADGAYASANMMSCTKELLKTDKKITVLAIAGKNEKAFAKLQEKIDNGEIPDNITLKPYRFLPDAYELYCAADIFVTKGGPNAICDSMFMHTPVIVNYCATPIEEYTAKLFCTTYKCGKYIRTKKAIRQQIERWIDNPEPLRKLQQNTLVFDVNSSGEKNIADLLMKL